MKRERGRRGKEDAESAERGIFSANSASSFPRFPCSLFIVIFLLSGIAALSYVGYTLLDARLHQAEQSRRFEVELKDVRTAAPAASTESVEKPERLVREGDSLGRIEINRIGLKAMVEEGVSARTLRRAVGHIPSTPLPGERGNVAFAAHRDTHFRALRHVRPGDEITLTTLNGSYNYRVDSTRVVKPEQTEVLNPTDDDVLTLVTCYPFNFVGTAPQRFIVRASKVSR